jgi:hypothetical protein
LQVDFAPGAPYPDRLLNNGHIEHIGEGHGAVQLANAGNRGMLDAANTRTPIPVFQAIGPKNNRRYVDLGSYQVLGSDRRILRFLPNEYDTDAFVFTLAATPSRLDLKDAALDLSASTVPEFSSVERAIIDTVPIEGHYAERMSIPPVPQREAVRREAALVKAFAAFARVNGKHIVRNRIVPRGETEALYTDIYLVQSQILIEAKGSTDRVSFRMALGHFVAV